MQSSHTYIRQTRFYFLHLFIYFEKREREQGRGRQRGKDRENPKQVLCTVTKEPDVGLEPMNCEMMTWAKTKSLFLNKLNHPGDPDKLDFKPKTVTRDEEGDYIIIKGTISYPSRRSNNCKFYSPNLEPPKNINKLITKMKKLIENNTISRRF